MEIDFSLVVDMNMFLWGIEIELFFSVGIEIDLILLWGVEIVFVFACGPKMPWL